jgi:hypothetical protein
MVWTIRIVAAVLLISTSARAQETRAQNVVPGEEAPAVKSVLPDKPVPRGNFITRPFYDKKVRLLAAINAGTAVMDDVSSRKVIDAGGYEKNPLIRPFVHNSGTLAVESAGEVWLMAFVADRMKHSSHPVLRKTWWLPQTLNISAKAAGGSYNTVLLLTQ